MAVTDEQIITALLSSGTIKDAAVGLSERTVYDRMRGGDFKALYAAAKADILREATNRINAITMQAIQTTADIMTDKEVNPATRLQAVQAILNNAAKFAARLNEAENLTATRQTDAFLGILDF